MLSNSAPYFIWLFLAVSSLPHAAAMSEHSPFPDITFKAFSGFITTNFSSKISLATVLLLLFTMTENPELLSLHARQQHRELKGEKNTTLSAWIKSLSRSLVDRIGEKTTKTLFRTGDIGNDDVDVIATKLDAFAKLLNLTPYKGGRKRNNGKLKPISHQEIQPVLAICPNSVNCEDMTCEARGLLQSTEIRDIPLVTLIKGTTVHKNVIVLGGKCSKCGNIYQADHDHLVKENRDPTRVYVNSAKYLKIGQNTWVDRSFASAVLNGMYSFHASASAYTEFWNNSYGTVNGEIVAKITRRQVWQAFIQESIRMIAAESKTDLEIRDGLSISDKTKQAFAKLGNQGIIPLAKGHTCSECTQPYREPSDVRLNIDAAAVVGIDERRNVPPLIQEEENSEDEMMAIDEENITAPAAVNQALQNPPDDLQDLMDVDVTSDAIPDTTPDVRPKRDVTMDVLDGLVMGPFCCAADDCTAELKNH
jgi:CxC5 like cysteine cluster associated with KDZ transposases